MKNKKGKVAQRTVPVTKKPPPPKKKDNEEDLVSIVMNKYSKPKTEQRRDDFNENIKEEDRKTEKADPFVDLRELKNEERKKNGEKLWKPMYKNTCMYFIQAVEEKNMDGFGNALMMEKNALIFISYQRIMYLRWKKSW